MSRDHDMNDTPGDLGRDETAALEALRKLPRHAASAELRTRTRKAFLASAAQQPRASRGRPHGRGQIHRWSLAAVGAAAAVIALLAYLAMPRDSWVVVDVHMGDEVSVAGAPPIVGTSVRGGLVRTTPCSEVEFAFEERLHLRFLSDAEAELPTGPGRWLRHDRTLRVESGEVYGSTGGSPLDFRLRLQTDEATALLTGTTFAVFRVEDATCFCLYSGGIEFTPAGALQSTTLPVGQRVFIYKDGRPPSFEPLTPRERMKLEMIHDAAAAPQPEESHQEQ